MTVRRRVVSHAGAGRRRHLLAGGAAALVLAGAASSCGTHSGSPSAAPTSVADTTGTASTGSTTTAPSTTAQQTSTTATAPPTTATPTTAIPVAPQSSAEAAASALVSGWADGNRAVALSVAVPAAVNTLFAVPYPNGNAVFRGCSDAFPPLVCSYGPPALGSGPLFQIYVSQTSSGGWYVSEAMVET